MTRILFVSILLIFITFLGEANDLCFPDTLLIKKSDVSKLLKSRDYIGKTNFLNQPFSSDYYDVLKSSSNKLEFDSIVVSEWSEETEKVEKTHLYTCNFENDGKRVVVNIFYWDAAKNKWFISDENYYLFDENGRLKQVEFQEYFLPTYRWYTRIYYEYENGLLKSESRYDRVDEIEFWDEIEQIEYLYNNDNSLNVVNLKEWDIFENDWITNAYRKFAYDSIGNLTTETGFDYNFYDVESTKKFELQYSYDNNLNLIEIVKYGPGFGEGLFEEERKQENTYTEFSELSTEIFYNWDYDLKIWNADSKNVYSNETQGIQLFEESSYVWKDKEASWKGSNKVEYLSEYNYYSEDINNWEFLQVYMPAFSFDGMVCDKIENTIWENDQWLFSSAYNYYFSIGSVVGIETVENLEISIYPNPVVNVLSVKIDNLFETTCTIRDLNGRILSQTNFQNNTQVDVSYLKSGIYFIELFSENERIYVDKIIKN